MKIYGCTLKEYEEQYAKRLRVFKDKFEDRDESIFLEREMINFKDFHNVLVSIYNCFIKNNDYHKLINDPQFKSHFSYLQNNYNNVFNELFQIGPPLLDGSKNVSQPDDIKEEHVRGYIFYFDVTKEKLDNFITSTKRIIEFINKKLINPRVSDIPENKTDLEGESTEKRTKKPVNKYPQVFSGPEAFELFEKLHETYKANKYQLSNYSFIYRIMYEDGYIRESFKPQMFINWIGKEPYSVVDLDKIKTMGNCKTDSKIQTYNMIKKSLQIK